MPRIKQYEKRYKVEDLSKYITRQMKANGMNQTDLANVCGISQQVLSKRLRNHTLKTEDLIAIFTAFDVDGKTLEQLLKVNK